MISETDVAYIESQVNIQEWIDYDPNVGVDGIQYTGLPGSGKTSMANRTVKDCIKFKDENWLIPGDRFCEWRHFLMYPRIVKKITLFIPEGQQIYFEGIPTIDNNPYNLPDDQAIMNRFGVNGFEFETIPIEYKDLDINHYFDNSTKKNIFVMFDNHYQGDYLWKRSALWNMFQKQLLDRTQLLHTAFGLLFHEAGILWQQGAKGKHWHEVDKFAQYVVEDRKGLIRNVHLSQLETEEEHDIRKKLLWKVYRFGTASKSAPYAVRSATPFQARTNFILMKGGLYTIGNVVQKFTELKEVWKMIPIGDPYEIIQEQEELEKQKEYEREKKNLQHQELMIKRQEERKQNRLYIMEKELQFKKELMEKNFQQKLLLEEKKSKDQIKKKNLKVKDYFPLFAKGIKVYSSNKEISINQFSRELGISDYDTAKIIHQEVSKMIAEEA